MKLQNAQEMKENFDAKALVEMGGYLSAKLSESQASQLRSPGAHANMSVVTGYEPLNLRNYNIYTPRSPLPDDVIDDCRSQRSQSQHSAALSVYSEMSESEREREREKTEEDMRSCHTLSEKYGISVTLKSRIVTMRQIDIRGSHSSYRSSHKPAHSVRRPNGRSRSNAPSLSEKKVSGDLDGSEYGGQPTFAVELLTKSALGNIYQKTNLDGSPAHSLPQQNSRSLIYPLRGAQLFAPVQPRDPDLSLSDISGDAASAFAPSDRRATSPFPLASRPPALLHNDVLIPELKTIQSENAENVFDSEPPSTRRERNAAATERERREDAESVERRSLSRRERKESRDVRGRPSLRRGKAEAQLPQSKFLTSRQNNEEFFGTKSPPAFVYDGAAVANQTQSDVFAPRSGSYTMGPSAAKQKNETVAVKPSAAIAQSHAPMPREQAEPMSVRNPAFPSQPAKTSGRDNLVAEQRVEPTEPQRTVIRREKTESSVVRNAPVLSLKEAVVAADTKKRFLQSQTSAEEKVMLRNERIEPVSQKLEKAHLQGGNLNVRELSRPVARQQSGEAVQKSSVPSSSSVPQFARQQSPQASPMLLSQDLPAQEAWKASPLAFSLHLTKQSTSPLSSPPASQPLTRQETPPVSSLPQSQRIVRQPTPPVSPPASRQPPVIQPFPSVSSPSVVQQLIRQQTPPVAPLPPAHQFPKQPAPPAPSVQISQQLTKQQTPPVLPLPPRQPLPTQPVPSVPLPQVGQQLTRQPSPPAFYQPQSQQLTRQPTPPASPLAHRQLLPTQSVPPVPFMVAAKQLTRQPTPPRFSPPPNQQLTNQSAPLVSVPSVSQQLTRQQTPPLALRESPPTQKVQQVPPLPFTQHLARKITPPPSHCLPAQQEQEIPSLPLEQRPPVQQARQVFALSPNRRLTTQQGSPGRSSFEKIAPPVLPREAEGTTRVSSPGIQHPRNEPLIQPRLPSMSQSTARAESVRGNSIALSGKQEPFAEQRVSSPQPSPTFRPNLSGALANQDDPAASRKSNEGLPPQLISAEPGLYAQKNFSLSKEPPSAPARSPLVVEPKPVMPALRPSALSPNPSETTQGFPTVADAFLQSNESPSRFRAGSSAQGSPSGSPRVSQLFDVLKSYTAPLSAGSAKPTAKEQYYQEEPHRRTKVIEFKPRTPVKAAQPLPPPLPAASPELSSALDQSLPAENGCSASGEELFDVLLEGVGRYVGQMGAGAMEGRGQILDLMDNVLYDGWFKDNEFEGIGTLVSLEGAALPLPAEPYLDLSALKSCISGYSGQFSHSLFNGLGTIKYAEGSEFSGQFKHGKAEGMGLWTSASHKVQGFWSANQLVRTF